jgi:hypothetical protein
MSRHWTDHDAPWYDEPIYSFRRDENTGHKPEGTEYLFNLHEGEKARDARGELLTKVADGPTQGDCVIVRRRRFTFVPGDEIVKPVR